MSKREVINFETINKGNYTVIPAKDIEESRVRIAKEMSKFNKTIVLNSAKKVFEIARQNSNIIVVSKKTS